MAKNDRTQAGKICVYMAANAIEGNLIRGLLESEGIEVELYGDQMTAYPGIPRVSETRVFVRPAQRAAAQAAIRQYEQRGAEQRHWRCRQCGESNTAAFETCWQCQGPSPEPLHSGVV